MQVVPRHHIYSKNNNDTRPIKRISGTSQRKGCKITNISRTITKIWLHPTDHWNRKQQRSSTGVLVMNLKEVQCCHWGLKRDNNWTGKWSLPQNSYFMARHTRPDDSRATSPKILNGLNGKCLQSPESRTKSQLRDDQERYCLLLKFSIRRFPKYCRRHSQNLIGKSHLGLNQHGMNLKLLVDLGMHSWSHWKTNVPVRDWIWRWAYGAVKNYWDREWNSGILNS